MERVFTGLLQDNHVGDDKSSHVPYHIRTGDTDDVTWRTVSQLPDPGHRRDVHNDGKLQRDRPEHERAETVRESARSGHDVADASLAVHYGTGDRREPPRPVRRAGDPASHVADQDRTDLQRIVHIHHVPERSCLRDDRAGAFFSVEELQRHAEIYVVHNHADVVPVQHVFLHRTDA